MIYWSRGANLHDVRPQQRTSSDFEALLAALEADPGRAGEKLASSYFCAPMAGSRCADNVQPVRFLAVDADGIEPDRWPDWRMWWTGFSGCAWPTHSDRPESRRERVLVELQRPASREEAMCTGRELLKRLEADFGAAVKLDPATLRPEQPCFLPPRGLLLAKYIGDPLAVAEANPQKRTLGHPTEDNANTYGGGRKRTDDDLSHLLRSSVGALPPDTIPRQQAERNKSLFRLARWAKARFPGATEAELRDLVAGWHEQALPAIGTRDFATSWADFMRGHERVKYPLGEVMSAILDGFDDDPLPAGLERLRYGVAGQRLVRACVRLAAHHAPEPFFLSARQAAEVVSIHFTDANKLLQAFCIDAVLALVERGAGTRASRFRYVWPERATNAAQHGGGAVGG